MSKGLGFGPYIPTKHTGHHVLHILSVGETQGYTFSLRNHNNPHANVIEVFIEGYLVLGVSVVGLSVYFLF